MKWPRRRRAARRAHEVRVDEVLQQAQEQCERAERVAAESLRVRRRNHFAELLDETMHRRRHP